LPVRVPIIIMVDRSAVHSVFINGSNDGH
jgi:hypothetical protein